MVDERNFTLIRFHTNYIFKKISFLGESFFLGPRKIENLLEFEEYSPPPSPPQIFFYMESSILINYSTLCKFTKLSVCICLVCASLVSARLVNFLKNWLVYGWFFGIYRMIIPIYFPQIIPKTTISFPSLTSSFFFPNNYLHFIITSFLFTTQQQHEYEKKQINMCRFMSMKCILISIQLTNDINSDQSFETILKP
jgi:hypothetical protein